MKVTITGFKKAQNLEGKDFIALELQGDIVVSQSENGKFYITAKRCSLPCTFTEEVARTLIGQQIPGRIEKVACDAYNYTVKDTGEVISLTHRFEYFPENKPATLKIIPDFEEEDLAA